MDITSFRNQVSNNTRPIIVEFWAGWCAPCKVMAPALDKTAKEYSERVDLLKVNADESQDILRELGVMAIPTIVAFSGGNELFRRTGTQSESTIRAFFEAAVNPEAIEMIQSIQPNDRFIRLAAALALLAIGLVSGISVPLIVISALVFFSAVYDRCPIYNAIRRRLSGSR